MPEPEGVDSDLAWDEVVDVICVGAGPGVLAYGLCCAAADLDVLLVESPAEPDAVLADLLAAMTEDLGDTPSDPGLSVSLVGPEPTPMPSGRKPTLKAPLDAPLAPFVGHQLRDWSARCLASPYGVMFTQIPDLLTPMRTDTGECITAAVLGRYRFPLAAALREKAGECGLVMADRLAGLVVEYGRIAGAALDTASGPWRVGATAGIALSVGPEPSESLDRWAADARAEMDVEMDPEVAADRWTNLEIAMVGRRFGRFARVELIRR